jgi:hypothetical protein
MRGELFAGASVSVLIFEAGARVASSPINIDLNDRITTADEVREIQTSWQPATPCLFVFSGEFNLPARLRRSGLFWSQRWSYTLAEITSFRSAWNATSIHNPAWRRGSAIPSG